MKKLFILISVFAISCGSKQKVGLIKTDSGIIAYQDGANIKLALGTWEIKGARRFKDSSSTSAEWGIDTFLTKVKLEDVKDTLKVAGKPSYDSANHKYNFVFKWYTLNQLESNAIHYSFQNFRTNPK